MKGPVDLTMPAVLSLVCFLGVSAAGLAGVALLRRERRRSS